LFLIQKAVSMPEASSLPEHLLNRYNRRSPRYTSYPLQFVLLEQANLLAE